MRTALKMLIIALLIGIPLTGAGKIIWPPAAEISPTPEQIALFIPLALAEGLLFGLGVGFFIFGWGHIRGADKRTKAAFVSLLWLLLSWWPHGNMHLANGLDINGVLIIDYTFHFTIIIATVILAWYFWGLQERKSVKEAS